MFDIRQQLKKKGEHQLVGWLNGSCTIQDPEAETELVFTFLPAFTKLHKGHAEESAELIAEIASEILGRTVTIRCIESEETEPARSSLVAEAEKLGARRVGSAEPDA